ncbi:hypothetical protein [Rodentibacter haemolyticus]|uniref:Uncharacterized protein n=1 Tax=Rodentibacter haemolyticus TaxID=2778911 RepID=A0ABX6UXP7_9PAST|nr:hypothetical protein [Rodentibacter haemolyticus]QPB42863.1 hypothetical protein IHV77_01685 [Rodentibacter haemolyticus]
MGLDAYAYAMSYLPEKGVDFTVPEHIEKYPEDRELERERDLNFVRQARAKLKQGLTIFYDSWW